MFLVDMIKNNKIYIFCFIVTLVLYSCCNTKDSKIIKMNTFLKNSNCSIDKMLIVDSLNIFCIGNYDIVSKQNSYIDKSVLYISSNGGENWGALTLENGRSHNLILVNNYIYILNNKISYSKHIKDSTYIYKYSLKDKKIELFYRCENYYHEISYNSKDQLLYLYGNSIILTLDEKLKTIKKNIVQNIKNWLLLNSSDFYFYDDTIIKNRPLKIQSLNDGNIKIEKKPDTIIIDKIFEIENEQWFVDESQGNVCLYKKDNHQTFTLIKKFSDKEPIWVNTFYVYDKSMFVILSKRAGMFVSHEAYYSTDGGETWDMVCLTNKFYVSTISFINSKNKGEFDVYLYLGEGEIEKIRIKK
jgi:hypothetical protein